MDVFAGEEGASDYHSAGGCKVYTSVAVVVRCDMQAIRPDYRSVHCLPSYLRVHVADDNFHVPSRAAVVDLLQLRVERFFFVIGSPVMWAVDIDDAVVEETALDPHLAHPCVDRLPTDYALSHLAQHYEAGSQLVGCATALVEGSRSMPAFPHLLSRPAKFLQRHDVEVAGM